MTATFHNAPAQRVATDCPSCGGAARDLRLHVRTDADYSVRRCRDCGLAFSHPRPSRERLAEFYASSYFRRQTQTRLGYADYREMAELNARRMWGELGRYLTLEKGVPRRLLDVGCATGGFLAEASAAGWDCTGLELSASAAEIARREFGLHVVEGELDSAFLQDNFFGLITMWHVLEHLIDPSATLSRAAELLSHRAALLIELPNWDSLGRVMRGKNWSQLKPPEHINYFTPQSLQAAVRRCGLKVVRCDTHYPSVRDRARLRGRTRPMWQCAAAVASVAARMGRGGYLRLLAQKV